MAPGLSEADQSHDKDTELVPIYECAKRSHEICVKTGVNVFIPHSVLKSLGVVQSLLRNNVSSSAISSVMHDIIKAVGGDASKVSLRYATTERYQLQSVHVIMNKMKMDWTPSTVDNLHWDGKLMETLDRSCKTERLPVLLSGVGGTKLLGVPEIEHDMPKLTGSNDAVTT